jgi:site-specific DNA recombinase
MSETLRALAEAQQAGPVQERGDRESAVKVAECERKLAQYRAALDAGANPATVAAWIAETEAEKAAYALVTRRLEAHPRMTEQEIKAVVDKLADVARVLSTANPDDKSEIFRQLGLRLTYQPGRRIVEARIEPAPRGFFESVRGRSRTLRT